MQKLIIAITALLLSVSCATINSSAEEGDITSVRNFVNDGIDVNKKDENGVTPLMMAVKSNNPELVSYLIEKGADVNAKDKDGYTPIMYTKYSMLYAYAVKVQKEEGDNSGQYFPIEKNWKYMKMDQDCEGKEFSYQYFPQSLYWTKKDVIKAWDELKNYKRNIYQIISTLTEKGADLNILARDNDSVLNYAIYFHMFKITEFYLQNGADADTLFTNMVTKKTNIPEDWIICDYSILINPYIKKEKENYCKIQSACYEQVSFCLENVNVNNIYNNQTMMSSSIKNGDIEMFEELVKKHHADVNIQNKYKETPVFYAIGWTQIEILEKLIEYGADLNVVNIDGHTPLTAALIKRRPNATVIKMLIDNGADVNFVVNNDYSEYDGMSVMEIAKERKIKISVKSTTIHSAAERGKTDSVKRFLKKGININQKDENGATPLMLAVKSNNPELVAYLIEKGADVNAKDKDGYTPIMYTKYTMVYIYAIKEIESLGRDTKEYFPIEKYIKFLSLDKKSTQLYLRMNGYEPSFYWKEKDFNKEWKKLPEKEKNLLKIIQILIEKNANLNDIAKKNNTILNYALRFQNKKITEILLKNGADPNFILENEENKERDKPSLSCWNIALIEPYIKNKEFFCNKKFSCYEITDKCIDLINKDNFVKDNSYKLLSTAINKDDTEMIEKLVKKGADINIRRTDIKIPDIELGELRKVIDRSQRMEETPIFNAVREKKIKSLKKLIELGADINSVNYKGLTPVIVAITAYKPDEEIIQTLIDNGVDLNFVVNNKESEYNGMSVMQIAEKKKIPIKLK